MQKVRHTLYLADPVRHGVCAGRAVVCVDDDDGDDDGGDDKHHGEEHVLPDERHGAGGGRDELHDDQQEHSQREQDGDAQSHLLTWRTRPHVNILFAHISTPSSHAISPQHLCLNAIKFLICHHKR